MNTEFRIRPNFGISGACLHFPICLHGAVLLAGTLTALPDSGAFESSRGPTDINHLTYT
jgi:hypothetical protein